MCNFCREFYWSDLFRECISSRTYQNQLDRTDCIHSIYNAGKEFTTKSNTVGFKLLILGFLHRLQINSFPTQRRCFKLGGTPPRSLNQEAAAFDDFYCFFSSAQSERRRKVLVGGRRAESQFEALLSSSPPPRAINFRLQLVNWPFSICTTAPVPCIFFI